MEWDSQNKVITIPYNYIDRITCPTEHKNEAIRIVVEDGYKIVPDTCFGGYSKVETVILPDSIEEIGNNFLASTNVKTFHIPKNYKTFNPEQSFDNTFIIERFTIDPDHEYYTVFDDALYTKDLKTLCYYPGGKQSKICIPHYKTETLLCASIAYSKIIETIIIPPSVIKIEKTFCYHLEAIKNIIIICCTSKEERVNEIDWDKREIFDGTNFTYEQIEWIESTAIPFLSSETSFLTVLPNLFCPNETKDYSLSGSYFNGNDIIKSVLISNGITSIKEGTFKNMKKLKEVVFPETIVSIHPSAFEGCTNLIRCSSIIAPSSRYETIAQVFPKFVLKNCKCTCNAPHLKIRNYILLSITLFYE